MRIHLVSPCYLLLLASYQGAYQPKVLTTKFKVNMASRSCATILSVGVSQRLSIEARAIKPGKCRCGGYECPSVKVEKAVIDRQTAHCYQPASNTIPEDFLQNMGTIISPWGSNAPISFSSSPMIYYAPTGGSMSVRRKVVYHTTGLTPLSRQCIRTYNPPKLLLIFLVY